MQVFKLFYKIVPRKFLAVFIIYTIIFVGLMMFFSGSAGTQVEDAFQISKVRVSIINEDRTVLANGLEDYLKSVARPVEIDSDEDSIKDALFFRDTEFIVTIPEGFQEGFASEGYQKISTLSVPDSTSAQYAKTIIESYLNTARLYMMAYPNMPIEEINQRIASDISVEADVSFLDSATGDSMSGLNLYFNFLSYIMIAMLISMVGRIMLIFNNKEIKMRNYCAPISTKRYNYQLILSNLLIALVIWIIFAVMAFVINGNSISQPGSMLFVLNSFVLTVLCLSISFFVSSFATKNSIDPLGNVFSLGLSFLGGSFVPQALLSDQLKIMGTFNPIFWYVRVNDTIGGMNGAVGSSLETIIYGMLVQLAFAVAFLAIALVIIKQKRYSL
ncbi:ABC transporter permease [Alkalibacter saccharofermentans]|uniref:ABC-2 type transport system permease protein n=1 Tax=Alkalibacter saccharofermentans DSM 14828 TaxID=1120975 RepID=A0A1M4ZXQ5_9FIRM|nr:ABC transporter permease [Alkalibacter saccharofermentans]SHF22801.1 ABC-2 type transport system permease protein [Alkalibacter saccharofermentans DSM 14828]